MKLEQTVKDNIPFLKVNSWKISHGFLGKELDFKNNKIALFAKPLYLLNQVHEAEIVDIELISDNSDKPNADGWIGSLEALNKRNIAIGIKTADCTPVLILGKQNFVALHCGWRSAYAGLLEIGINALNLRNEKLSDLQVAFGPSAQSCCYEVSKELLAKFEDKLEKNCKIGEVREHKSYLSVSSYLYAKSLESGIMESNIVVNRNCTICDQRYFSYRREKDHSGRQLSFFSA